MTLTEVVVSALILGIGSQVSLQGGRALARLPPRGRTDKQVLLLDNGSWPVVEPWPVLPSLMLIAVGILRRWLGFSKHRKTSTSRRHGGRPSDGLWLVVELMDVASPFKRSQFITPAGLGHCLGGKDEL